LPDAYWIPNLLAADAPLFVWLNTVAPSDAAIAAVWSVEPSSTTMTSTGFSVWAKTDFRQRGRNSSALNAGITTLILMSESTFAMYALQSQPRLLHNLSK
jgi:hypothetical protein